eukprot:680816-Hanusia_phi.AAC.2
MPRSEHEGLEPVHLWEGTVDLHVHQQTRLCSSISPALLPATHHNARILQALCYFCNPERQREKGLTQRRHEKLMMQVNAQKPHAVPGIPNPIRASLLEHELPEGLRWDEVNVYDHDELGVSHSNCHIPQGIDRIPV